MNLLIKNIIGNILLAIFPKRAIKLAKNGITIDMDLNIIDRLLRFALLKKAESNKDFSSLSKFHHEYWSKKGREYFSGQFNDNILENFFIPKCSFLFELLEEKLRKKTGDYNMLVEIGTGDGTVLDYLSSKFQKIDRFVGIDLSLEQVEDNKIRFKANKKLQFVKADGFNWIKENGHSNMVLVTSRGVLEYFTQSRLQAFFDELNSMGKVIFIAIEPSSVNHDFSKNPNSEIYGFEKSFSHNYLKMFENSGFSIWHQSKILQSEGVYFNFIGAESN